MTVVNGSSRDARSPEEPTPEELGTMTLFEHLSELRNRVIVAVIALVATTLLAWFFYDRAIDFMRSPYCTFIHHHPKKGISGCNFVTNGPLDGFTTRLKISAYGGVALAAPVWMWELWRFITPGLHKNEKRYIVPFVCSGVVLFAMGVTVAILIFPHALDWLIDVGGTGVVPLFAPSKYLTLYCFLCLVFGLVFMYPLLLVFLEISGVVPSRTWRKWRRIAIVVIALVAAVATPSSDPFSFLALAIPMYIFYEASIILGRLMHK